MRGGLRCSWGGFLKSNPLRNAKRLSFNPSIRETADFGELKRLFGIRHRIFHRHCVCDFEMSLLGMTRRVLQLDRGGIVLASTPRIACQHLTHAISICRREIALKFTSRSEYSDWVLSTNLKKYSQAFAMRETYTEIQLCY